jgi:hypothetical protein
MPARSATVDLDQWRGIASKVSRAFVRDLWTHPDNEQCDSNSMQCHRTSPSEDAHIAPRDNCGTRAPYLEWFRQRSCHWQEGEMESLESDARAHLCRRLAELEPHNRDLWLAEAEKWSHQDESAPQDKPPAPDPERVPLLNLHNPAGAILTWLRRSA